MKLFIVSIESKWDPGSPYYRVVCDSRSAKWLEDLAHERGLVAYVNRPDSYDDAHAWLVNLSSRA